MSEDLYGHAFHVGIMPTLQNEDIMDREKPWGEGFTNISAMPRAGAKR